MSDRWRGIVAALLNPDLRSALAELVEDEPLTPARRARARERLAQAGLLRLLPDGSAVFDAASLRALLAEDAPARPMGVQRFLDGDGRIDRYPVRADDRRALLEWVVQDTLGPDEVLTEPQLNARLERRTDDVAALRRHLVDHGLLERTRSGTEYARVSPEE